MRVFKYICFLLLILIIGFCTYISVQPNTYNVSRSRTINVPTQLLFEQVRDYQNWDNWSPWIEKDSSLNVSCSTQNTPIDSSYSWKRKDRTVKIKTIMISPHDSIHHELQFENQPISHVYWNFEKDHKITLRMTSNKMTFMMKFFALIAGGMDKMVGPNFERSLEKLEHLILESMHKYEINITGIKSYGGGYYLYKTTNANSANISQKMKEHYSSIARYMMSYNIPVKGIPLTVYQNMNIADSTFVMSNGLSVNTEVDTKEDSGILCAYIPHTKALKTILKGNYTKRIAAWTAAQKYIRDNALEQSELKPFEIYINDPKDFPNPSDWITELYIPIKE
ncbi:MAG: SRPBCC family protein [Flavobacteriaceae bacterium]|nr:SRPBCC family protein [Flavobacteriaceae bacterium]